MSSSFFYEKEVIKKVSLKPPANRVILILKESVFSLCFVFKLI